MAEVKITQLPLLNSVVIKQQGVHFFISAPNSLIIDRDGLLRLIEELVLMGFIDVWHLTDIVSRLMPEGVEVRINENKEDGSNSS